MAFNSKTNLYEGYIYCIRNTVNNKSYVGQTSKTIHSRWCEHVWDAFNRNDNVILHASIRKYGVENFDVFCVDTVTAKTYEDIHSALDEKEIYYISALNTLNPNGYNMNSGGYNTCENTMKKVYQFSMDGAFLNMYDSLADAERDTKIPHSCISRACYSMDPDKRNSRKSAGGFLWSYTKEPPEYVVCDSGTPKKKVVMASLDGETIKIYDSMSEAAIEKGLHIELISKCCNGTRKSTGGYRWAFL